MFHYFVESISKDLDRFIDEKNESTQKNYFSLNNNIAFLYASF